MCFRMRIRSIFISLIIIFIFILGVEFVKADNVCKLGNSSNTFDEIKNLNACIEQQLKSSENLKIYIPSGVYEIFFPISININTNKIINIEIYGDGPEFTKLIGKNNFGIIFINLESNKCFVAIRDLSLLAGLDNSGNAITISQPYKGNLHKRNVVIKNVNIENLNNSPEYTFQNGIIIRGAWRPLIENVFITGFYGPKQDEIPIKMNTCILLEDSYSPDILNSGCWRSDVGIRITSSLEKDAPEGFRVAFSKIVDVNTAILIDFISKEPEGTILFNHINSSFSNIVIKNRKFVQIIGNLFYRNERREEPNFIDIIFVNTDSSIIKQNIFHYPSFKSDKSRVIVKFIKSFNNIMSDNLITDNDALIYSEENSSNNFIDKNLQYKKR